VSTAIKSRMGIGSLRLEGGGLVTVGAETRRTDQEGVFLSLNRADFLAAVETECGVRLVPADALVIDRAELPPVTLAGSLPWPTVSANLPVNVTCIQAFRPDLRADEAIQMALAWLALAEYLAAHLPTPPVGEADVEALAGLMPIVNGLPAWAVARRMLATGRVSVTR